MLIAKQKTYVPNRVPKMPLSVHRGINKGTSKEIFRALRICQKKATGEHFSSKGQKQSDMEIMILEKLHNTYEQFRKQREKMFIQSFNTKHKGMNKELS